MLATLTKMKPDPPAADSDFSAAKARWTAIKSRHDELTNLIQGLEVALGYAARPTDWDRVPANLKKLAEPHMEAATRKPDRVRAQLRDAVEAEQDLRPELHAEWTAFEAAKQRETSKIALELQPRQRQIILQRLIPAVEQISDALIALADLQKELQGRAPNASSMYLPDVSFLLPGRLDDWSSPASQWRRQLKKMGIIQ